jgi:hypothetical protein
MSLVILLLIEFCFTDVVARVLHNCLLHWCRQQQMRNCIAPAYQDYSRIYELTHVKYNYHRKHITYPLRAQQVNAIYRLVTVYNCHNSEHYPLSCLSYKTQRYGDWIISPSSGGTYSIGSCLRRQKLALSMEPNWVVPPEDGDRIQSPKRSVLNKRQDNGYVQNYDSYINILSSQTYR